MANLFMASKQMQAPGGYLTNKFATPSLVAPPSTEMYTADSVVATGLANKDGAWWGQEFIAHAAAAPVDVVDTLATLFPGVERGEVNDAVYQTIGLPGVARWVREHQGGVEIGSGLLGAIVVGGAAAKVAKGIAGAAWFQSTGVGGFVTSQIARTSIAQAAAAQATLDAAAAGRTLATFSGANRTYLLTRAGMGAMKAGASEVAVVAALHNNTAIWSDDMTTNAIFFGLSGAIGGVAGAIGGRGVVQRWANSQTVKDTFQNAADPGQYDRVLSQTPFTGINTQAMSELRGPVKSAEFTALMLNSTRDDLTVGTPLPGETRPQIRTGEQRAAIQALQTMTRKGVRGVGDTKFQVAGTAQGKQIIEAAREDPTVLLGTTELGQVPQNMTLKQFVKERAEAIKLAIANPFATAEEITLARQQLAEKPLVLMGKRWLGMAEAEELVNHTPLNPKQITTTSAGALETTWKSPASGKQVTLRQDGRITGNWEGYQLRDKLAIVDGMRDMSNRLMRDPQGAILTVPKNPTYMELDFAAYHHGRGGNVDFNSQAGFASIDELQLQSLRLKATRAQEIIKKGGKLDFKTRLGLNLPLPNSLESATDPQGAMITSLISQSLTSNVSIRSLKDLREQAYRISDIGMDASIDARLDADIFNWNRTGADAGKQEWMAPVIGVFDDPAKISWSRWNLGDMVAEQKALMVRSLTNAKRAPFAASLTQSVLNSPGFRSVMDMLGLNDAQIGGTKGVVGTVGSQLLTQAHRFRNNETLMAAQNIRRAVNRQVEVHLDAVLSNVKPYTDQLVSVSGGKSRVLLNQYMTSVPGWDIEKVVPTTGAKGQSMFAFELRGSARNIERLNKLGKQWTKGMTLRSADGVEVVLDDLGNATREAMEKEYKALLNNRNQLRIARGLEPIEEKAFYVPPPSTKDKKLGFVLDADNRVVPGMTVIAKTQAQFDQLRDMIMPKINKAQGQRFVTQGEIEDFADLWEQAEMGYTDPLDFVDPQALSGAKGQQTGRLASAYINPRSFEDSLEYLKHGYEQVGSGVIRTIFDSQLKISSIRHQASKLTHGQANLTKDIWETYDEALLGISATANPRGVTTITKPLDAGLDAIIEKAWNGINGVSSNWAKDLFARVGFKAKGRVNSFADLAQELGPHMPFATVNDMAQYNYGLTPPWKAAKLSRGVNRFASGIILRWLELPHAVMNMTGLITAMPVLLTAKNVPTLGKINGVGVVDATKIMARGLKRQFKHSGQDWDYMVKNGDTTQDVAELHHQLSLLDGKGKFGSIMLGDPKFSDYAKHPKGSKAYWNGFLRFKGVEGMASIVTDTSENFSRRAAHFVGLELADHHGIVGLEARHNFARQFANDTIANYDPLNRPEIFQSAFGSMYGLFLSYAQNYYQRLYRWVEDGDFKSVGKSMAMQSAIFGIGGTPGFRELATLLGGEEDGDDLVTGIYERFGPAVGAVIAQGGMNQITTLVGLPPVSLHTRGDVSVRHPAIDFAKGVPTLPVGLEVIKDLMTGFSGVLGSLTSPNDPQSSRYAAEIMARNMPSRAIRGALSVLALGGQEADVFGNLMSETKNDAETLYRMLGLRSAHQQKEIEAYFMNQKSLAIDGDRMQSVRAASRALIRDGAYDRLPEVFDDYINAGGKPWNYSNWVEGLIEESSRTRGQNQLYRMMKSPGHEVLVNRLRMMGLTQE